MASAVTGVHGTGRVLARPEPIVGDDQLEQTLPRGYVDRRPLPTASALQRLPGEQAAVHPEAEGLARRLLASTFDDEPKRFAGPEDGETRHRSQRNDVIQRVRGSGAVQPHRWPEDQDAGKRRRGGLRCRIHAEWRQRPAYEPVPAPAAQLGRPQSTEEAEGLLLVQHGVPQDQ